jgi:hypothetical protein
MASVNTDETRFALDVYQFNWNGLLKVSGILMASLAMWGGIIRGIMAAFR